MDEKSKGKQREQKIAQMEDKSHQCTQPQDNSYQIKSNEIGNNSDNTSDSTTFNKTLNTFPLRLKLINAIADTRKKLEQYCFTNSDFRLCQR
jgi:hypothetical protein